MNLQMKSQEKIGVAVAMSLGIFAGATAVVKCTYLPLLDNPDFSCKLAFPPSSYWCFVSAAAV